MTKNIFLTVIVALLATSTFAQDNAELDQLYELDQTARQSKDINWEALSKEDAERRRKVLDIFASGGIRTARDFFNAAMIFQHGESAEDIRIAHSFATLASALDSDMKLAKWLKAATWDRILLRFEQPQWYGTQYIRGDTGDIQLYEVAPDIISDEQRAAWAVPSLDEARARTKRPTSR